MKNVVDKCKKCGNYVKGEPIYSSERKLTRSVTKQGVNWGLKIVIVIICTFAGAFLGIGIGAIPGFFVGIIISLFFGNATNDLVDELDQGLFSTTEYKFECPRCGNTWHKIFSNKADTETDEMLANKKEELVNQNAAGMFGYGFFDRSMRFNNLGMLSLLFRE